MSKPKKWPEIYPYGTKEGDEEAKFFKALARHPKYDYRSIVAIVKATGLTKQRVEEIIDKYVNKVFPPLLFQHLSNDDHWGYWERCQDRIKDDKRDISTKDKDSRVDKHIAGTPSVIADTDVQDPLAASQVMSTYDMMTKILKYSHEEAEIAISKKKLDDFSAIDSKEYLKLQIIAQNRCGLMVPAPESSSAESQPISDGFQDMLYLSGLV